MATKSKWINGALCFYDTYPQRIVDAWGCNVHKYLTDFMSMPVDDTTGDPTEWTTTVVEAGTGDSTVYIKEGAQGGALRINAADNENDGAQIVLKGESFIVSEGDYIYFNARFSVDEATQSDFLIGLVIGGNTTLLGGMTDGIYFRKVDGSTDLNFVTEKNSTETSTKAATFAANTTYHVTIVCDGTGTVHAYCNTTLVATHTTNIPDDEYLTIGVAYLNGAASMQNSGMLVMDIKAFEILNNN